jgi:hypothetical protein
MKFMFLSTAAFLYFGFTAYKPSSYSFTETVSPLSAFSSAWNAPQYKTCNTAAKANYMSVKEKEIIYILNMARMNPKLFAATVVKKYPEYPDYMQHGYLVNTEYYTSLLDTMSKMKPMNMLYPDSLCFVSAQCHAYYSGLTGYTGHQRDNDTCKKVKYFYGECCDYGPTEPLDIVMHLLIDEDVPSLGHRYICFGMYRKIGVSMQPHKAYGINTVMDFYY